MHFFALLIVLALLQWWGSGQPLQRDGWLRAWQQRLRPLRPAVLRLAVGIGAPVLAVVLIAALLAPILYGLALLIFSVCVLLYSLGRGEFKAQLQAYLEPWRRGDIEAAYRKAGVLSDIDRDGINDAEALHQHVREAVFYQSLERWFAVVFWFMCLGPAAALAYRLTYFAANREHDESGERALATQWLFWLDWIPARLLAFTFALTGEFSRCFAQWKASALSTLDNRALLARCGALALLAPDATGRGFSPLREEMIEQAADELVGVQSLIGRSVVAWILALAFLQFF